MNGTMLIYLLVDRTSQGDVGRKLGRTESFILMSSLLLLMPLMLNPREQNFMDLSLSAILGSGLQKETDCFL